MNRSLREGREDVVEEDTVHRREVTDLGQRGAAIRHEEGLMVLGEVSEAAHHLLDGTEEGEEVMDRLHLECELLVPHLRRATTMEDLHTTTQHTHRVHAQDLHQPWSSHLPMRSLQDR